jgi:hypothetical protein
MKIDQAITYKSLQTSLNRFWQLSGKKINSIEKNFDPRKGAPVFTVNGKYTTRGWTEWTQGFQYGSALLQFDATGEAEINNVRISPSTLAPVALTCLWLRLWKS